jgi:hypothetical protein
MVESRGCAQELTQSASVKLSDAKQMGITKGSEASLIASRRCGVLLLVCLVMGLPLIAQTTNESDTHESADAGTAPPRKDRSDKTPQAVSASGDHYGKKAPQNILIDSKADFLDTFLATRKGKRIVGALSVAIGMVFLLTRRIVSCGCKHVLKNEHTVKEYEAIIQRDTLLLLGFIALMLGTVYVIWSTFPVQ